MRLVYVCPLSPPSLSLSLSLSSLSSLSSLFRSCRSLKRVEVFDCQLLSRMAIQKLQVFQITVTHTHTHYYYE